MESARKFPGKQPQGYSICINFHRDQTTAQKLVRELEKEGTNAQAYQADVSREEEVEALFQTVDKHLETPRLCSTMQVISTFRPVSMA